MRFLLLFSLIFFSVQAEPQVHTARIFIHGTILAGYFFVDISASLKDEYKENSLMERAINAARKHHFLHQSELVLGLGLVEVTDEITTPVSSPLRDDRAAIEILRAFERTNRCLNGLNTNCRDYTFGWSGALSERKRNKESQNLYHALMSLQHDFQKEHPGDILRFEIYAHSHGGQLIAHLPTVHKQFPANKLFIDLAVLCAAPLYKEKMQPMISSPLFGTIISFHSLGDKFKILISFQHRNIIVSAICRN